MMKCVILAGGKGTRLWPISRENMPKQFLKLTGQYTMLQETVLRNMPFASEFLIITGQDFVELVDRQMKELKHIQYSILVEPCGKNTAPAIAMACFMSKPDQEIFVVPADADIVQGEEYTNAVLKAKQLARQQKIVTFGIRPTHPHTGYGYIHHQEYEVKAFKEKPNAELAQQYLQQGDYLWNSGMFLFQADTLLQELKKSRIDIYDACQKVNSSAIFRENCITLNSESWSAIPAESIDYAVMEHSDSIVVVPSFFPWDDIGGLDALAKRKTQQDENSILYQCDQTQIINQTNQKLVVAAGVDNLLVIATDDVVYIAPKGNSALNKEILEKMPIDKKYR